MMACAQRTARAGPSKVARKPSPIVLTSRPRNRAIWLRTSASCRSRIVRPFTIAVCCRLSGGVDDVGKQDGGQQSVEDRLLAAKSLDERADLA